MRAQPEWASIYLNLIVEGRSVSRVISIRGYEGLGLNSMTRYKCI